MRLVPEEVPKVAQAAEAWIAREEAATLEAEAQVTEHRSMIEQARLVAEAWNT